MQITLHAYLLTPNVTASLRQVEGPFAAILSALGQTEPAFERLGALHILLSLAWPFQPTKVSGSYHKPTATFHVKSEVNYARWIRGGWSARVAGYGDAVRAAVEAIHKTRISEAERQRLQELVDETEVGLAGRPPDLLEPIGPVWLSWRDDNDEPSISYVSPGSMGLPVKGRVEEVSALDALEMLSPSPPEPSRMFKLYRRQGDRLEYREAWPTDGLVVEQHGFCGEAGGSVSHPAGSDAAQDRLLAALKQAARDEGFRPIPEGRLACLIVRRPVHNNGSSADLDERHRLETFLDERTGWLGLGHCDGGSIGGGWMESYCYVVDFDIARRALAPELAANGYGAFEIVRGLHD